MKAQSSPAMAQISSIPNIILLVIRLEEVEVLEAVLPERMTNNLPWERKGLPGRLGLERNYTD